MKNVFNLVFTCFLYSAFFHPLKAQENDLYSPKNSVRFADYLVKTKQYKIAIWELERIDFMNPGIDSVRLRLIKAIRFDGDYPLGIKKLSNYFSEEPSLLSDFDFSREYVRLVFHNGQYRDMENFLVQNRSLPRDYVVNLTTGSYLLQSQWTRAREYANTNDGVAAPLLQVLDEAEATRLKSPFLAGTMSVFVPGLGKAYSGQWKDGLISLVFVAANAFASYRGFSQNGVQSFYGWFFGAMGTGFYIGNIYGSARAATQYNERKTRLLHEKARNTVYTIY